MELVTMINGVAVASSAAIADGTENQHKNVLELIRTYRADLEEFGGVAFETQPFETPGGLQRREVALLNEEQSTLLITYLRNNEIVRGFKKRLVRSFYEQRGRAPAFAVPQTYAQALLEAGRLAAVVEQQQAQLEAAKPAVEFVDRFVEAKSSKCLSDVAKLLGWKPQAFIAKLSDDGVIFKRGGSWVPTQGHIDAGRFTVKTGEASGHAYQQTRVTPNGVAWLAKRMQAVASRELATEGQGA